MSLRRAQKKPTVVARKFARAQLLLAVSYSCVRVYAASVGNTSQTNDKRAHTHFLNAHEIAVFVFAAARSGRQRQRQQWAQSKAETMKG